MAFHRHLYNQCLLSIAAGLCRLSFFNVCFIIQERRLQSLRDQNIVVVGGAGASPACAWTWIHRSQIVAGARQ